MSIFFAGNELRQRKGIFYPSFDPDFLVWYNRVIAAGSSISAQNIVTLDKFFRNLKSNNLWDSITQANILCGTSSLAGCLIPIKGATPVNNNFVTGDYSVTLGLQSNGSNKWLDTTILESSFSTNPDSVGRHFFVATSTITSPLVNNTYLIGSAALGGSRIYTPNTTQFSGQIQSTTLALGIPNLTTPDRLGTSRQNGTFNRYLNGVINSGGATLGTITTTNTIGVYAAPSLNKISAKIQFYSFGYYANLATLDSVVSSMISALV